LSAHLTDPHVLCLILNNDLLEEMILFGGSFLSGLGLLIVLLLATLLVQISQVDFVAVLVLECVQGTITPFFKQELTQV